MGVKHDRGGTCDARGRAWLARLAVLAVLLAPSQGATAPARSERWASLATAMLQPIAQNDQLPNSAIPMALTTDAQGFLWVGTQNGLARWDGQRFKTFNGGESPGALPDSQIETLHTDAQGRLWIGTLSGGLARYDRGTDRFRAYTTGPHGLSHAAVHAIADAPGGRLWVGTEAGLDLVDPATNTVSHTGGAGARAAEVGKALAEGVHALATDRLGDLWIGTHGGLLRRDHRTGLLCPVAIDGAPALAVNALLLASDGRLWIGSEGHGAYVLAPSPRSVRAVPDPQGQTGMGQTGRGPNGTSGMRVRALLEPRPGEIWLGAYDDGLITVDPATLASRRVRAGNSTLLYGDQNIRTLYRAADGLVFIGANSAITRYDPRRQGFFNILGGAAPTATLKGRNAVALFEAPDHRLWVSQMADGVDLIDPEARTVRHLAPRPGGMPKSTLRGAAVLGDGRLLFATDIGLYRSTLDGRSMQRIPQPGRAPDARVQAIVRDGERLWLGGRDGVWGYRLAADGRLTADVVVPADKLSDHRTDALALDPGGNLWIATDNGLNRYDPRTGAVERIVPGPSDQATPRGFIASLSFDSRGRLWVATFGHGLSTATPGRLGQPLAFRSVGVAQGLPNDNVNRILEDDFGKVWASTDSGLARIDPDSLKVDGFRGPEGVAISSFFYNSGVKTTHGELLFGGRDGITLVRPDKVKSVVASAPLVVTDVREGGRVLPGDPFVGLKPGAALDIAPGLGALEVHFAALDYAAPEGVRYAYKLSRQDGLFAGPGAWVEADPAQRVAAFTNLAPGRYRLDIRATDPGGRAAPRTLNLPIHVLPAWWRTLWFHGLEAIAGLLVVLYVIWSRTAWLQHRRIELENLVDERTHALRAQKEVLEEQAVELAEARARAEALAQTKSDFLANMSHEIRTPLNGVVAVADLLARSDLGPKEREMAEIIRASGDTLQRLLSDILDSARIESGKISIETAPFQAGDMVRAVAGLWRLKCDEKGIRLAVEVAPEIDETVIGDLARVRQIITNLLSNAIKFTERGEIRLTAERRPDGRARFTVIDSGIGFAADDKAKVLGRFQQADSSITRRYGGTGLGLSICCDLAALMGGGLDCDSAPGVGSRFWLDLPLEPAGAPSAEALAAADSALETGAEGDDAPLRILVADDHPTNRKVVQLMLEACAALGEAENGAEALDAFRTGAWDLVLMDMQMPVMDGLTAVREIRRLEAERGGPRTPIVMLTANALPEHVAQAQAAGADLHLSKPFTSATLFDAVNAAMALAAGESVGDLARSA